MQCKKTTLWTDHLLFAWTKLKLLWFWSLGHLVTFTMWVWKFWYCLTNNMKALLVKIKWLWCVRVIHFCVVNDKLDILLLLWPDSESFGKWCLEKCKKFFDTTTLMPAKSVPKFYYITHLCEIEQNGKFFFFQFFQKKNIILLFEYFTYIKNVIFWGTSCWCSSKFEGSLISYNCSFWAPI